MREITEVFPEGSLEFWRDKSEKLIYRVHQLERQLEATYCAFCGERFELDDAAGVTQHIRACEKHPMRAVEVAFAAASARLEKSQAALRDIYDACYAADCDGELDARIDGDILDAARIALLKGGE